MDGRHSLIDLSFRSGLPLDLTEDLLQKMAAADLVALDGDPVPIGAPRQPAPA